MIPSHTSENPLAAADDLLRFIDALAEKVDAADKFVKDGSLCDEDVIALDKACDEFNAAVFSVLAAGEVYRRARLGRPGIHGEGP